MNADTQMTFSTLEAGEPAVDIRQFQDKTLTPDLRIGGVTGLSRVIVSFDWSDDPIREMRAFAQRIIDACEKIEPTAKTNKVELFDELVAILDGDEFPEINPRNYTHEEAERLNQWACDLIRDVDKVLCQVRPKLPRFADDAPAERMAAAVEKVNCHENRHH